MGEQLTPRQEREAAFHKGHAERYAEKAQETVSLDVVENKKRRWWNAYWSTYTIVQSLDIKGRNILVPGCGFGEDAIRFAHLGGNVHAFDLSPDILKIAQNRATNQGCNNIKFDVMASEHLDYPDNFFDVVFFLDILHHVDIQKTMEEVCRVLKPGGIIVGDELYTHNFLQKTIRNSTLVEKILYPMMVKFIYGTTDTYLTEDEHKITEDEFELITARLENIKLQYYNIFIGRISPEKFLFLCKADRLFAKLCGSKSRFLAGRIVFYGRIKA